MAVVAQWLLGLFPVRSWLFVVVNCRFKCIVARDVLLLCSDGEWDEVQGVGHFGVIERQQ